MDQVVVALLNWGAPGAIIVVLGWAYWRERERNERLTDKRIQEMRESLDAINRNTSVLNGLADLVRLIGAR